MTSEILIYLLGFGVHFKLSMNDVNDRANLLYSAGWPFVAVFFFCIACYQIAKYGEVQR